MQSSSTLRGELEANIRSGQCVYCRRPAAPDEPLTREHVIPRARGGRRKDARIIVPACAACNHRRGCQELCLFLLLRPRRISAFLDYLCGLSPDSLQEVDLRVFSELYAAVWMLTECADRGSEWRAQLRRIRSGRILHRRRYAARRVVGAVGGRLGQRRSRAEDPRGPGCMLPAAGHDEARIQLDEPLERLVARLIGLLSLVWRVPVDEVYRELSRELSGARAAAAPPADADEPEAVLDGWKPRARPRRLRVDRRRGRSPGQLGGRAA